MGKLKLGLDLVKKLVDTAKKVEKPKPKPKPKLGGAGGRKFKDRVKPKPGSGKSFDDLMKEPGFQKALESWSKGKEPYGELTLGKINKAARELTREAARRKPKVNKKPMATKINAKSPKDKLEDAVIVGGAIGTAAVLGNKVKEKNKPKKTVKKAKGGMIKKAKGGMIKKAKGGMAKKTTAKKTKKEHDKWKDSFTPKQIAAAQKLLDHEATKVIETFKRREEELEERRSRSTDPAKPPKKIPGPQVFSKGGMAKKTSAKKASTRSKPKGVGVATGGYGRAMR